MSYLYSAREKQAETLIKSLAKRNIEGFYCKDKTEAGEKLISLLKENSSVTWGGSETLKQCGIPSLLKESGRFNVIDRSTFVTDEERKKYKALTVNADYYLMSTNAITSDGILMNIDGNGDRVASLIFGPKQVIILAGMNKISKNTQEGYDRIKNLASPPNAIRFNKNTPCTKTGFCGDCLCDDCICNQVVITRRSRDKDRIKVILINEDLGF